MAESEERVNLPRDSFVAMQTSLAAVVRLLPPLAPRSKVEEQLEAVLRDIGGNDPLTENQRRRIWTLLQTLLDHSYQS